MDKQQALNQLRIMRDWHEDNGDGPNADYDAICSAIEAIERSEDLGKMITALEQEHAKLREMQSATDTNVGATDARQEFMDIVYAELEDDPDNNRANRIIWAADGYAERRVDDALQVIEELQFAKLGTNLAEVGTDCISRQAAIDALCDDYCGGNHDCKRYPNCENIEPLQKLPPAQPEQRTGKWIVPSQVPDMVRGYWAKCSACGHSTFGGGKFCRECGAKMEGDAE